MPPGLEALITAVILAALVDWQIIRWLRRRRSRSVAPFLPTGSPPPAAPVRIIAWDRPSRFTIPGVLTSQELIFGVTVALYLATRFWGLERFPIYFFGDEAVQAVLASDLVQRLGMDEFGQLLPTFFRNVDNYSLGLTVYLQVIPTFLFGKTVLVTRATSVLISLLGVVGVSLTLKNIFSTRWWWCAGLFLSITPAWFLHSRTAFEATAMVSFFAMALYCYLMYRNGFPRYLYYAVVFGALCFYTYTPGQVIILFFGCLLLISDWPYHRQQRAVVFNALGLAILLALPFLRFLFNHPQENIQHLRNLGSYWVQPLQWTGKVGRYFATYLKGLNPVYWYLPNSQDLVRHVMKGYGHIHIATAPFTLLGIGMVMQKWRLPAWRTLILAVVAVPTAAAFVDISLPRVLVMVIPVALLAGIGASIFLDRIVRVFPYPKALAGIVTVLLASANIFMTADALSNGPTWFRDYSINGMAYGSRQVFEAATEYSRSHPTSSVLVSSSWNYNVEALGRFFVDEGTPVHPVNVNAYLTGCWPLDRDSVFLVTPGEIDAISASGHFEDPQRIETLFFPDGNPAFHIIRLEYVQDIREILARQAH